jgi:hypothetical protein
MSGPMFYSFSFSLFRPLNQICEKRCCKEIIWQLGFYNPTTLFLDGSSKAAAAIKRSLQSN